MVMFTTVGRSGHDVSVTDPQHRVRRAKVFRGIAIPARALSQFTVAEHDEAF
jgi:hypothetical protein